MDDSYFEADLFEQFRLAEADYQIYPRTDTCEDVRGHEVPGGKNEAIETSDNGFRYVQIRIFAKISMFPCAKKMRKEARLIELLIAEGCKCSLGPKKWPCCQTINRESSFHKK